MTTNSGPFLTDMLAALPMPTNLSAAVGQVKLNVTCSAAEAPPETITISSSSKSPSNWDCGEMLTGISGHFSATHKSPEGQWHGHTWHVKAWFRNQHRLDARVMEAALNTMLARYDHSELPESLAWGEDIAREIATLVNCVEVEVSRPAEGIHAKWKWNKQ